MTLLKEAAAEGGSFGNLDCREALGSGRAWELSKAGRRSDLQFALLSLKALLVLEPWKERISLPRCLGKLEAGGTSPQEWGGLSLLEEGPSTLSKVQGAGLTESECPILGGMQAEASIGRACWKKHVRVC